MNLTSLGTKDWHARAGAVRYETRHFIDGKFVDSVERGRFTVTNPATGAPLCEVSAGTAAAIEVDGLAEALTVANDSIYGLAASVWTRDLSVAHKTVRDLEAGVIWVNCFDHGDMTQPFGGYKQSGQGRDKCVESLLSYTQTKSAWINLG